MRISGRRAAGAFAALVAVVASGPPSAASEGACGAGNCRVVQVPVTLDAAEATLAGDVCAPTRKVSELRRTVQVLVSGTAYGKGYWDFPYQPDTYSYVRAANAAGFTTFNLDRLGIGASTHLPSPQITIPSNADSIHQVIRRLRAGDVDGVRYDRVVLVGHSLGSLIALYEAAAFHDVDAVIASGILHTFDGPAVAKFGSTLYPAAFDPRFAGTTTDPGYLTTLPGTRAETFYHLPNADPQVIATDEATKATATFFEARDVFAQELPGVLGPARTGWYGITPKITVPVLSVVGQYDALLCGREQPNSCADTGAVQENERAYYRGAAARCFGFVQVPDAGHDLNLHRNAQGWFALANQWAADVRPSGPCPVVPQASTGTAASPSPPSR